MKYEIVNLPAGHGTDSQFLFEPQHCGPEKSFGANSQWIYFRAGRLSTQQI
jgi:hypothetical protein